LTLSVSCDFLIVREESEQRLIVYGRGGGAESGVAEGPVCAYASAVNFDYNQYFERRREVCGGELIVKGTRVTLRSLLASLAEGASVEEIHADFPSVTPEALRAVVAFAEASAEEDLPAPSLPAAA
jgi:uncharacterized protein (DUF433 family)